MNKFNLLYSHKNIPNPSKLEYKKGFLGKTEDLVKRMRFRAWHFLNPSNTEPLNTFGFRTAKQPPKIEEMKMFESEIFQLIRKIEFKNVTSQFQDQMKKDITKIKECKEVIVKGDKTTNLYKVPVDEYKQLLTNNITNNYRKTG